MKSAALSCLLLAVSCLSSFAEIIPATWSSTTTSSATGALSANTVTLSAASNANFFVTDLTTSDYSFAPLSATETTIGYDCSSKFTAKFALPVTGLLTYVVFYRGIAAGPATVVYSFDKPFTVVSGLTGAIKVGNTFVVGNAGFFSGIIRFPDTLTSITLDTNATGASQQATTFSVNDAPPTVQTSAAVRVPARTRFVTLRGSASAPIGIQKVEVKIPGKAFAAARGTEQWTLRVRLQKPRTNLLVRATSGSGKVSPPVRVVVRRR